MTGSLEHEPGFIGSFDGTMLAVRRLGNRELPPLLLVPSVGSNLAPWRRALPRLLEDRHVVTWDLRGLHESGPPVTNRLDAGAHAEDAVAVMDEAGLGALPVVAWSTGGRIAVELAHRYPERVTALMLACGMNGYPLGRLFRNLDISVVLPLLAGVAKHFASVFGAGLRTMAGWPELGGIVRQSGLLAPTADIGAFVDMLKGLAECDTKAFLATYEKVAGDPAPGALEGILAPTMLVLGDKDRFMPHGLSEQIAAAIPGTEVHEYEGATHFLPLEFPARLSGDIKEFLDRLSGVTREEVP